MNRYKTKRDSKLLQKLKADFAGFRLQVMDAISIQNSYIRRPDIQQRQIVIMYTICDGEKTGSYGFHYESLPLGTKIREESWPASTAYVVGTIKPLEEISDLKNVKA